ncbi:hypothetical protein IW262DRAFT_279272 [Armillaria fumosa]|nr:hypothetical protein IW262DRAFT_279272 [Armillaria fumosa]
MNIYTAPADTGLAIHINFQPPNGWMEGRNTRFSIRSMWSKLLQPRPLDSDSVTQVDWIIRQAPDWNSKSCYNVDYDVNTCGYTVSLSSVARFHNEVFDEDNGLRSWKTVDFRDVTTGYERHLKRNRMGGSKPSLVNGR